MSAADSAQLVDTRQEGDEPAEWTNDDLPNEGFPVEEFIDGLERRMLGSESRFAIRSWAKSKYGIDKRALTKFQAIVRYGWLYEQQSTSDLSGRRQNVRMKLEEIYSAAMHKEDLRMAHDVVKTMADLDGLRAPDVNLTQINVASGHQQITNRSRERVAELMDLMRLRADRRKIERDDHVRMIQAKNGNGKNGNGHG